jgi:uncharacterized protein (DUF1330 family)
MTAYAVIIRERTTDPDDDGSSRLVLEPEYQAALPHRQHGSISRAILVAGTDQPVDQLTE